VGRAEGVVVAAPCGVAEGAAWLWGFSVGPD